MFSDQGDRMLKTLRAKLLAVLAAVGLGTGVLVTVNSDGCTVKPAVQEPAVDAGDSAGEGEAATTPDALAQ